MRSDLTPLLFFFSVITLFSSCQSNTNNVSDNKIGLADSKTKVELLHLRRCDFQHEIISNGTLNYAESADLYFNTQELVQKINVKNGDFVRKGDTIAILDTFRLKRALEQNKSALERAQIEMQDILISQGFYSTAYDSIPTEVLNLAKIKSGYTQQLATYDISKRELSDAVLTAPFDGLIANLTVKQYNLPSIGMPFCRINNPIKLEALFTILENEIEYVNIGDRVEIRPYSSSNNKYMGHITEINPIVGKGGSVQIKASIDGKGKLYEGMNLKVIIKRPISQQLVIPKSAVVLRSGRQVVFSYSNGRAIWNYVKTNLENSSEYTIVDGLQEEMDIIISGNESLAHETEVELATSSNND